MESLLSVSDPALLEYLGIQPRALSGVTVSETTAFGQAAFWRGVNIVAGTIAGLPLKGYAGDKEHRVPVKSFLDDPAYPYTIAPFTLIQTGVAHAVVHGETFLRHNLSEGGQFLGVWPIHPSAVSVRWSGYEKRFKVRLADGTTKEYDESEMTQVMGLTMDGLRGMSLLTYLRNSIGTGIAGEQAAARSFTAPLIAGVLTPDVDIDPNDAKLIKDGVMKVIGGVDNAGDIAVLNKALKFTPWQMSNADAQFLESREFQLGAFAQMLGVPLNLLMVQGAISNWGTGVQEANLGLHRYTLSQWTNPFEQAFTRLMPVGQFAEFEYAGLMQGTPEQEIKLLIEQVDAGLLTVDEARAIRNLPPLPKGLPKPTALPDPKESVA